MSADITNYRVAPHTPSVLIVEDDHILSQMYEKKFTIEGFSVKTARDGEQALAIIKDKTVDCVLLDLHIPIIDGVSLLEKLQKEGESLPIVLALTNMTDPEQRTRALSLGVKEYLVKAMLTPEKVVDKVKEYIKLSGSNLV